MNFCLLYNYFYTHVLVYIILDNVISFSYYRTDYSDFIFDLKFYNQGVGRIQFFDST